MANCKWQWANGKRQWANGKRQRAKSKKRASPHPYIIGIDEVGRGALAGPVAVAAVLLNQKSKINPFDKLRIDGERSRTIKNQKLGKLRDSKKLSAKQREAWFEYFKQHPQINFAVARVYPRQIEKLNITKAANLAAERAYVRLAKTHNLKSNPPVFLDGGLFIGNGEQPKNARTVVRGDEKINAIKAASIVAKVTRDRAMVRLAKSHRQYGFEIHKGYGTKAHMRAIKRYGSSEAHRSTFI